MEDNFGCITLIGIFLLNIIFFAIGFLTGINNTNTDLHREICQQLSISAEDYINCNAETLDKTISRIIKTSRIKNK